MNTTNLMATVEAVLGKRTALLTVSEFAEVTGRHYQTIYKQVARGEIKAHQSSWNAQYRIPVAELRPFFETRVVA